MKDNSGPAFPFIENDQLGQSVNTGMTKRELIAMHALQGILAYPGKIGGMDSIEAAGKIATLYADALLAELAKE